MRRGIEKESLRVRPDGRLSPRRPIRGRWARRSRTRTSPPTSASRSSSSSPAPHAGVEACLDELTQIHQVGLRRHRRGAALGLEHALRPARRRRHPDRPVRQLQHRPRQDRVPHRPLQPLRPAHAGDQRHPLQLVAAGPGQRRVLRAHPQLPAPRLAALLPVRRLARGVPELRRRHAQHGLQELRPGTLYLPHATTLRMGRLGYQSEAQDSIPPAATTWSPTARRWKTR